MTVFAAGTFPLISIHRSVDSRHLSCTCLGANLCPPPSLPKPGSSFRPLYLSTPSSSLRCKPWESPWPILFHILHPIHHKYHELSANISRYTQNLTTFHPHSYQPVAGTSMAGIYFTGPLTHHSASTLVPKLYRNMADRCYLKSLNPNMWLLCPKPFTGSPSHLEESP